MPPDLIQTVMFFGALDGSGIMKSVRDLASNSTLRGGLTFEHGVAFVRLFSRGSSEDRKHLGEEALKSPLTGIYNSL